MEPEPQSKPEPTAPPGSTEDERPEPVTPPIDEDMAGSVNAAVPDTDE
jgi:hypothetical protein